MDIISTRFFLHQVYTENQRALIFGGGLNNLKLSWEHQL